MKNIILHEGYLKDALRNAVESYTLKTKKDWADGVSAAQRILNHMMESPHKQPQHPFGFSQLLNSEGKTEDIREEQVLGKRKPMIEESPDDSLDNSSMEVLSKKIDTVESLISFRKDTRAKFAALNRSKKAGPYSTDDPATARIIRAHTLGASVIHRITAGQLDDTKRTISRLIDRVNNLPKGQPTDSEKKCLEQLNDDGSQYQHNRKIFLSGVLSGTPDAILMRGGKIAGVAEFKDAKTSEDGTYRSMKSTAFRQTAIYAKIASLQSGSLCIERNEGVEILDCELTKYDDDLNKRVAMYNNFVQENLK